jgi:hypothetical protein
MAQLYQDSMAIVRQYDKSDLFITMTCNPKWKEIVSALKPSEIANDRPDLVTRDFVGKLQHLLDELLKKGIFGKVVANIHVIEWQTLEGKFRFSTGLCDCFLVAGDIYN